MDADGMDVVGRRSAGRKPNRIVQRQVAKRTRAETGCTFGEKMAISQIIAVFEVAC